MVGWAHGHVSGSRTARAYSVPSSDLRDRLAADQVFKRLTAADELGLAGVEEHFGRQGLRVVVRAHREAIGAGAADHQQIADVGRRASGG